MKKREEKVVRAIYYKEIANFFKSIGLFEKFTKGEINCNICGEAITIHNFKMVTNKGGHLLFCCKKEPCIQVFLKTK